jgi:hypothetical protein
MDDLKLIERSEAELRKEMRIVKTINNDIKMESVLQKCASVSLKGDEVNRKQHIGNTVENEI